MDAVTSEHGNVSLPWDIPHYRVTIIESLGLTELYTFHGYIFNFIYFPPQNTYRISWRFLGHEAFIYHLLDSIQDYNCPLKLWLCSWSWPRSQGLQRTPRKWTFVPPALCRWSDENLRSKDVAACLPHWNSSLRMLFKLWVYGNANKDYSEKSPRASSLQICLWYPPYSWTKCIFISLKLAQNLVVEEDRGIGLCRAVCHREDRYHLRSSVFRVQRNHSFAGHVSVEVNITCVSHFG